VMTEEEAVEKLRKQIGALSAFGGQSLRTHDLDRLLHQACELVSEAMGIELVKVLELLPDGETMLVRAGVNWNEGVVGHATFPAHASSPSGYAIEEDAPIISRNIEDEDRFLIPQLMTEHGVRSMVNVVIRGERAAWGVLEVDAREPRDFDENDISFLQNYANLIASAIERLQTEAALRKAVARSEILLGELNHRVRNMISNIRLLARRTVKTSADLDSFAASFEARLAALGRTQDLLAAGTAYAVGLSDILRQELRAHGADSIERLSLLGPDVEVPGKTAQALGMAFHELATNAGKHGALAHDGARLEVSWRRLVEGDDHDMFICWRERGVPIDHAPSRRGFGSETIERSLPYMLGGEAQLVFHPDGLECLIRFPSTPDEHRTAGEAEEDRGNAAATA
jgi:two-component sensor histidine kinase